MHSATVSSPSLPENQDGRWTVSIPSIEWRNPRPARKYNLVILGGGPAGVLTARAAAAWGAKVALIERNLLGGTCLNTGCIPSKTIIRTSRLYADMRNAEALGAHAPKTITVDFAAAMARMRRIRVRLSRGVSADILSAAGIDVYFGAARFAGSSTVIVADETLRFKKALIATGARPLIPSIPGLVEAGYSLSPSMPA